MNAQLSIFQKSVTLNLEVAFIICLRNVNPFNAEATLVQRTRKQKTFKPCHVGIHWIALTECSQMSTYVPGFQPFLGFFA